MSDPVLLAGLVLLVGTAAAMTARAARLPAAAGALLGGFLFAAGLRAAGVTWPAADSGLAGLLPGSILCFLLGAEIDPARLARSARSLLLAAPAQAVAVGGMVLCAALALGLPVGEALLLAAAAGALSPLPVISVTAEARARGVLSQSLCVMAPVSLALSLVLVSLLERSIEPARGLVIAIGMGIVCGGAILMPLSRMAARGAILTCVAAGAVLMVGVSTRLAPGGAALLMMSVVAGFMASNSIPNRDLFRECLRDVALACAVAWFALAGSSLAAAEIAGLLPAAVLVTAARWVGLTVSGIVTRGVKPGVLEATAQIPMAGSLVFAAAGLVSTPAGLLLTAAALVSEVTGMAAMRWALVRASEAAALSEEPEAWRAQMR